LLEHTYNQLRTCTQLLYSPPMQIQKQHAFHVALVYQWQYQVLHWRPCSSWSPCHHCIDLLSVHHSHHSHLLNGMVAGGLIDSLHIYIFIWYKHMYRYMKELEARLANQ